MAGSGGYTPRPAPTPVASSGRPVSREGWFERNYGWWVVLALVLMFLIAVAGGLLATSDKAPVSPMERCAALCVGSGVHEARVDSLGFLEQCVCQERAR